MNGLALETMEGMFEGMKKGLAGMIRTPLGVIAYYPQGNEACTPRGMRPVPPGVRGLYPQGYEACIPRGMRLIPPGVCGARPPEGGNGGLCMC